jgi:hypothetical protein
MVLGASFSHFPVRPHSNVAVKFADWTSVDEEIPVFIVFLADSWAALDVA